MPTRVKQSCWCAAIVAILGCYCPDEDEAIPSSEAFVSGESDATSGAPPSNGCPPDVRWLGPAGWREVSTRENWKKVIDESTEDELVVWFDSVDVDAAIDESLQNGTLTWIGLNGCGRWVPGEYGCGCVDEYYENVWLIKGSEDVGRYKWFRQAYHFARRFNLRVFERGLQWAPHGFSGPDTSDTIESSRPPGSREF